MKTVLLALILLVLAAGVYVVAIFGPVYDGCEFRPRDSEGSVAEAEARWWPPGTTCRYGFKGEATGVIEHQWEWAPFVIGGFGAGAVLLIAGGAFGRTRSA